MKLFGKRNEKTQKPVRILDFSEWIVARAADLGYAADPKNLGTKYTKGDVSFRVVTNYRGLVTVHNPEMFDYVLVYWSHVPTQPPAAILALIHQHTSEARSWNMKTNVQLVNSPDPRMR